MRILVASVTKPIAALTLFVAFTFCPSIRAQDQAQTPQCTSATTSSGTTQGIVPHRGISQSAQKRGERGEESRLNFQKEGPGQFYGGNSLPSRRHAHTCAGNSKCQCAEYGGSACSTCSSRNSRQFDTSRGGSRFTSLRAMAASFELAQHDCSCRST